MRKHRSSTTQLLELVTRKANQLRDARFDAAIVEYTEILMDWEDVDFNDLDRRISEAKAGGFPPEPLWRRQQSGEPKWHRDAKTVDDIPEAKGNFAWT